MILGRWGRWNPFATINERGGIRHQLFDPEQRITRHHPSRQPEALLRWEGVHRSLDFRQAHGRKFTASDRELQRGTALRR
jgi:hypothetical protein